MAGQIIKRGDNTWQIRVFLGRDGNGKRKYHSQTIHGTKKTAQQELTRQLGKRDTGELVNTAPVFLKDHLEQWLETKVKPSVKEVTFDGYTWIVNYLEPKLGMNKLTDLQNHPERIQKVYDAMTAQGLSPRTVRYVHSVLSSALRSAVERRLIVRNPCSQCKLPRRVTAEMKCFTADEAKRFMAAAKGDRYYALFLLAIETGLRPGEYRGLQWKDIDLDAGTLSVRRVAKLKKGGGFYFTEPKTKQSRRRIPLSATLVAALKEHRRVQLEVIMKRRDVYQDHDLVFASGFGSPVMPENLRIRHFHKIIEASGVPTIRLYDLRHTMATLLLLSNVNPKVVSERLGHSSIVLTLDTYSHVLPTMQDDATASMERLMAG